MKQPALWIALGVVVIGLAAWALFMMPQAAVSPETTEEAVQGDSDEQEVVDTTSKDGAPASAYTIRYTDTGFVPSEMTVPVGTKVTFINQTANRMWIGSDEHPSHTAYDGTNKDEHCPNDGTAFDQCESGATYSFTFTKAGTWGYHNHAESDHHGTVIVE